MTDALLKPLIGRRNGAWSIAFLTVLIYGLTAPAATALHWPWAAEQTEAAAPPRPVVSEVLDDRPHQTRSVPGVIAARVEVVLGFQTLGHLVERHVDIGDVVTKGQLLAALDPDDLQGNVAAATAAVDAAGVRLRTTQATAERTRELAKRNVSSVAMLEKVENALIAAEAAFQQANSELIRARDAEGYAQMNAPFAGVISNVFENAGAVVSAGAPVLQLSADDDLEAIIDLPETAVAQVKIGDPFEIWSEAAPNQTWQAQVRVIEPVADAATRTRRLRLSLSHSKNLRIGSLVRARPSIPAQTVLTIPSLAILLRDDLPHVWVVSRSGENATVALREIRTDGPEIAGRISVSSGLQAGEEIVTRGIHMLNDGQSVGRSVLP